MTKPVATKITAKRNAVRRKTTVKVAQKRVVGQLIAAAAASFLPVASFVIAHHEMKSNPYLAILVAAALLFSAPTLVTWATKWCGNVYKAIGFSVLLEGTMVFSSIAYLSYAALAILCVINCHAAYQNFGEALKNKKTVTK